MGMTVYDNALSIGCLFEQKSLKTFYILRERLKILMMFYDKAVIWYLRVGPYFGGRQSQTHF